MNRHEMVEREFADEPVSARMTQAESGIESEDVWWDMVAALTKEREYDHRPDRLKPYSRGRHHRSALMRAGTLRYHPASGEFLSGETIGSATHCVDAVTGAVTWCVNGPGREHQVDMDGTVLRCIDLED